MTINFKTFLEKAMNAGAYSKVNAIAKDTALVGFEYEILVPSENKLYSNEAPDRETERISKYDVLDEFEDFFEISKREVSAIESDFDDWKEKESADWAEKHYEEFLDKGNDDPSDDEISDAKGDAEHTHSNKLDFTDWLKSEFSSNYDFVHYYGLQPKYGWYDESPKVASVYTQELDDSFIFDATAELVKLSLDRIIDAPVEVNANNHSDTAWRIVPDASISDNASYGVGVEVVSPPVPVSEAIQQLKLMFNWISSNELETTAKTGFHINVSLPNIEDIDPLKLILFLGEQYIGSSFNRLNNYFAKSHTKNLALVIAKSGKLPEDAKDLIDVAWKLLSKAKYFSVNLDKINQGYLELRLAGGSDYHKNLAGITNTLLRFISALETAIDPAADRNEYLKKISKFTSSVADIAASVYSKPGSLPAELARFDAINNQIVQVFNNVNNSSDTPLIKHTLTLLNEVLTIARNFKLVFTREEKLYFKKLIKNANITSEILDKYFQGFPSERQQIKRELGI